MTIKDGGTLQVGDTLATDKGMTFSGGLKLNTGAILKLNDTMAEASRQAGDQIQVFSGKATGEFAEIQPSTPGNGLTWDTSELYTKGLLKVAGGETGIHDTWTEKKNSATYNLSGHRSIKAGKGIYIQDGRKVIR